MKIKAHIDWFMVENGKLKLVLDVPRLKDMIESLSSKLKSGVEVAIGELATKRSDKQNNAWWGVAVPAIIQGIKDQTGETYTKEDIHEFVLTEVIKAPKTVKELFGSTVITYQIKRTSDMSTKEFSDFWRANQDYWIKKEIFIPEPKTYPND